MNRHAQFLENLEHADVRETARSATRKRYADSRRARGDSLLWLRIGCRRCKGEKECQTAC
jgi:hypothetical protein